MRRYRSKLAALVVGLFVFALAGTVNATLLADLTTIWTSRLTATQVATQLTAVLQPGLALPKEIRFVNLSAGDITSYFTGGLGNSDGPYSGWAICDGGNGTPSLSGKFPRITTGAAGTTGGADTVAHTHDTDIASFNSGAEAAHTHTGPSHSHVLGSAGFADIVGTSATLLKAREVASAFTPTTKYTVSGGAADTTATGSSVGLHGSTDAGGTGVTGAGSSHLHTVDPPSTTSGAASDAENRPAFYELTAIMKT